MTSNHFRPNESKSYSAVALLGVSILVFFVALLNFPVSSSYSSLECLNYTFLLLSMCVVLALVVYAAFTKGIEIFEPISIVTVLFLCILVIYPMFDTLRGNMALWGVDVSEGCIKATIISVIGYVSFYLGYYSRRKKTKKSKRPVGDSSWQDKGNTAIGLTLWIISYTMVIGSLILSGKSLQYLLSFGSAGEVGNASTTPLGFMAMFGITLVVAWLYTFFSTESKALRTVITLLTGFYLLLRGARWLLLVFLVSPLVYYYMSTKKRVPTTRIVVAGFVMLYLAAWMQAYRYGFNHGAANIFESLPNSFESFFKVFESDFSTYKCFYSMVNVIPSQHSYYFGQSVFVYTLIMMIPRFVWPAKPVIAPMSEIMALCINQQAANAGSAYPSIAEYYADFGIIGVILFMYIFGFVLNRVVLPLKEGPYTKLIMYSTLFPLMFQWFARGSTGGNVWLTVFAFLPLIIFEAVFLARSHNMNSKPERKRENVGNRVAYSTFRIDHNL